MGFRRLQRGQRLSTTGGLQVSDRGSDYLRIVAERAEAGVAPSAQDSSDRPGLVVVVDLLGGPPPAERAHPSLRLDHFVDVGGPDAISPPKVVVPRPPMPLP